VQLHIKDLVLLKQIQSFFGVGNITLDNKRKAALYRVGSLEDLTKYIIPHFEKYPLLTKKHEDLILLKKVLELMRRKEHLSEDGCKKIVAIKVSMNNTGLNETIQEHFRGIVPVERPKLEIPTIFDPN
jgi:hypothetical protein